MGVKDLVNAHLHVVKNSALVKSMAFDTETDGLHGPMVLAAFADTEEQWVHEKEDGWGDHNWMWPPYVNCIVGHNLSYDLRTLMREGVALPKCALFDTAVAYHMLDETKQFVGLDFLAKKYLGKDMRNWDEVKDDPEALKEYAKEDARVTFDVSRYLWRELRHQGLFDYFMQVEMPLVPIIADMEHRGIKIDREEVGIRWTDAEVKLEHTEKMLRSLLKDYDQTCQRDGCVGGWYHHKRGGKIVKCVQCDGTGLNPVLFTSGDVQVDVLYKHFALPIIERTKSGKPSTDKLVLPRLKDIATAKGKHEAAQYIEGLLEYRGTGKMITTYYEPWFERSGEGDPWLHPNFHQTGTVSGRWSSSQPNFQNVPPLARPCMIPNDGCMFLSVDYTQIELYLLGYLAKEDSILEGYANGADLHEVTGRAIYGDVYGRDSIDPRNGRTHRWNGKTINFAVVYGLSLRSLAERLGCSQEVAKDIYDMVLNRMPNLETYKKKVIKDAKRTGYCSTILGRRRRLPDLNSNNYSLRGRAERQAINHTIQGSAGDLIKKALTAVVSIGPEKQIKPVLQIHDEVLFEIACGGDMDKVKKHAIMIKYYFERAIPEISPRVEYVIMPERWEAK